MATQADIPRLEMIQVADAVAREKGLDREEVLEAMELAIQKAGRSKYGLEHDIRAEIDRKSGEIKLLRFMQVVDVVENENTQIAVPEAQRRNPDAQVGDYLTDELPPIDFGRIAAQTAKQVITQRMRESERKRQYEEFKDRVGEIVSGTVKRVDFGNTIVDLGGRAEAIIRRDESIPREALRPSDRVRAYIYDVREEPRGPQIFLSRTHPQFMAKLFTQEVPEIYDGIIEIKAVARDPGSRAKIAVLSHDPSIDPIGACVGMRGSRVQAVVQELQGEKIDIIPWSPDTANFVVNALAPAEVAKVLLDEDKGTIEVVVPDDQLSLAIGRRGQNVRLAAILTGWDIDIVPESEESERRQKETRERAEMFRAALDVDEVIAHLLVAEGFTRIEEVAYVGLEELTSIEGFDEDLAGELQRRALSYIEARDAEFEKRRVELGVSDEVKAIEGLTPGMLALLGEKGVKTLDDLADLAGDELREIVGEDDMDADTANAIIMAARAHWFEGEQAPAGGEGTPAQADAGTELGYVQAAAASAVTQGVPSRDGGTEGPLRTCIATGQVRAPDDMIRFVVAPDGHVVPDLAHKLPGRGLWVTGTRAALEQAIARKAFARAARRAVVVDADLPQRVGRLLMERALEALALARRAGAAVNGFGKVEERLRSGRLGLVVCAADARGSDGRARLAGRGVAVADFVDAAAIGRVFGREDATYIGIAAGTPATRVAAAITRWAVFSADVQQGVSGLESSGI